MEVKVFSEWLREQWDDDAMPVGVPTRPVKVPLSQEMDAPEELRQFLIHHRHEIRSGRELLPSGGMFEPNPPGNGYISYDPPYDEHARLLFSKLFYQIKLGAVRGYLADLSDAVMGLSDEKLQGEERQWAVPYRFEWPSDELGTPPQDTDYRGLPCAISAKKRLKAIANFYKNKRDGLQRQIAKLPSVVAQEDSLRLKEQIDREAREAELDYKEAFSKA